MCMRVIIVFTVKTSMQAGKRVLKNCALHSTKSASLKLFVTCNIAECVDLYHFVAADAVAVMKAVKCALETMMPFSILVQKFADHQIEGK